MSKRTFGAAWVLLSFLALGCGPIIGQMMKASTGLKDFQVREGDLRDFGAPKNVLVYAPFAKGEKGYYLCRGDDEWRLAEGFAKEGLFATDYFFERDGEKAVETLAALRAKAPEDLKAELRLDVTPDAILSGAILERSETVAPTVGMIQELRLRLDLYDLRSRKTTSIEIAQRALHQETLSLLVKEVVRRVRSAA